MNALASRFDVDYRVIFKHEGEFARRLNDVYIAKYTNVAAPFFDEIFEELLTMAASIFSDELVENIDQYDIDLQSALHLQNTLIVHDDVEAAMNILHHHGRDFLQLFERDVYQYLIHHQITFYERTSAYHDRRDATLRNPPVIEVW